MVEQVNEEQDSLKYKKYQEDDSFIKSSIC